MIPNLPILERNVYRSGFTGSFYDPQTLLTKILVPDFDGLTGVNFALQSFEYNATVVHERVHWFQHHGTSFGCFLQALRSSQQNTTLRWLRDLPSSQTEALLHQRSLENPILKIDNQTQFPLFEQDDLHDPLNTFRQIWFDHRLIHATLEDSRICEQLGAPLENVFGEIVGDVVITLAEQGFFTQSENLTLEDSLKARQWFSMDQSEIIFASMFGMRLTSKILMEAPATIAELQLLPGSLWASILEKTGVTIALTDRVKRILYTDYGIPIRSLLRVLDVGIERLPDILPTVNVICFIALNPPLPPYVVRPPENGSSWHWWDIYPPIRFARLANAVKVLGLLKSCQEHKTIASYINDLCDLCQLPHTVYIEFPERLSSKNRPDFLDESILSSGIFNTYNYESFLHHDYIVWVQSKLSHYRLNALPLMVSLGDCHLGELSAKYIRDIVNFDKIPFRNCPLSWTEDNRLGFSCSEEFGNWLTRSILLDYALFDVVTGTGKYDLNAFPEEIREGDTIYEFLERSIANTLINTRNT